MENVRVAVYQGQPVRGDIESNLLIISAVMADCCRKGIDLVLFPELFVTGYDISQEEFHALALNKEEDLDFFVEIAKSSHCAIAFGYPEIDNSVIYNSCAVIDATGTLCLNYRKTHLWDPDLIHERVIFTPGSSLESALLFIERLQVHIRIGVLICFDCEFPEPSRVLVQQGAQLLLFPTAIADSAPLELAAPSASPQPAVHLPDLTPSVIVPCRAMENQVFALYANLVGPCMLNLSPSKPQPRFMGQSAIVGPNGRDIARAGGQDTGLIVAQLSMSHYADVIARNSYMSNRRPELYASLSVGASVCSASTSVAVAVCDSSPDAQPQSESEQQSSNCSIV